MAEPDQTWGHVFFVDDEPDVCAAVKETLEESRISVHCFTDPAECLARLRASNCDVLITDLKMPGKNGIELLKEVREMAPWIAVLIVTGFGDIPTAVKAVKSGAVDVIEKPLEKSNLVQKVRLLLGRSRAAPLDGFRTLTMMEMKVFRMVVRGKSNSEIGAAINRSIRTVEAHRASVMRKLGVHNVIELIKLAAAMGLVDLAETPGRIDEAPQNDEPPEDARRSSE